VLGGGGKWEESSFSKAERYTCLRPRLPLAYIHGHNIQYQCLFVKVSIKGNLYTKKKRFHHSPEITMAKIINSFSLFAAKILL
jgi:hypothetical protein